MADWVSISNNALRLIGSDQIQDPEENTQAARAVRSVRDATVDEVMVEHPWNCAMERATLAAAVDAPTWGFTSKFLLPADPYCLRVIEVEDSGLTWRVEGRHLLCDDAGPLRIRYLKRITDPQEISPAVANLISHRIAQKIAFGLTQSGAVEERVDARAKVAESKARSIDAQEGTPDDVIADEFVTARF